MGLPTCLASAQGMTVDSVTARVAGGNAVVPARAAMTAAETADFHWHLARADRERRVQGGGAPRHWRWRVRTTARLI